MVKVTVFVHLYTVYSCFWTLGNFSSSCNLFSSCNFSVWKCVIVWMLKFPTFSISPAAVLVFSVFEMCVRKSLRVLEVEHGFPSHFFYPTQALHRKWLPNFKTIFCAAEKLPKTVMNNRTVSELQCKIEASCSAPTQIKDLIILSLPAVNQQLLYNFFNHYAAIYYGFSTLLQIPGVVLIFCRLYFTF